MKIVTLGGATQDIFISYDDVQVTFMKKNGQQVCYLLLQEGIKTEIQGVDYMTGGGATNSAVSFKKLGHDVASLFKVGSDDQGAFILRSLSEYGIDVSSAVTTDTEKTGVSFIIPCPSGDRTLLVYRGANQTLEKQEINFNVLDGADYLYITSLSGAAASLLPQITREAHEKGIPVAVNPGSSQLAVDVDSLCAALPEIDILILNTHEAGLLMDCLAQPNDEIHTKVLFDDSISIPQLFAPFLGKTHNLADFFSVVYDHGPRIVVVTNGKEGVYVAQNDQILFHPSLKTEVVSTVGAGDAFASCFVAILAEGQSFEQAIVSGVINSASVIGSLGAKTGLLSKKELEKRVQKMGINQIQRFFIKKR